MLEIQKKLSNTFFAILSLPATAMGFALSVQISSLSWILITKYNLDLHQMGVVWAAGPIAGLIAQPIVGFLSDKVWFWGGRRRPFIIIGGILASLMLLALPNIDVVNSALGVDSLMGVAMVIALTLDLSINVSFNPTRSLIADVTPEGDPRTKGYTWMQTISGTFGVLAYAIGAVWGNYFLIYFGSFLVLLLTIFPSFMIEEKKDIESHEDEKDAETVSDDLVDAPKTNVVEYLKVNFANAFSWLGVQTMFVFIIAFISQKINPSPDGLAPDKLAELNNKTGQIISISFLLLNAVGAILPKFVLLPIAEKYGRVKTQAGSVAIMSLAYFGMAFIARTEIELYAFMIAAGIGWAAIVSLPFAIMSETVNKARMGLFMGLFNLSIVIPQLIVSWYFGKIIQSAADKEIVFLISGVSLLISAIFWMIVKEKKTEMEL
jgi:maltose/moltooligosaccharide transporter